MENAAPLDNLVRLFFIILGLSYVLFIWLEALFPLVKGSAAGSGLHAARNFSLWTIAFAITDLLQPTGAMFSVQGPGGSVGLLTRLSLPPIALSIIGILIIDLLSYTYHLAAHKVNWLWRIHAVHHSEQSLDATTSLRFHPIDFLPGSLWKMVGATILGIPLWVIALYQILIIPLSIFQHANIHVPARVERIFGWLLITPAIHKHHHSIVRREHDSNYGVGLVIWDRLFATLQQPEHPTPKQTGVKGLETEASQTIFGMLLTPLRYKPLKETAITNSDSV